MLWSPPPVGVWRQTSHGNACRESVRLRFGIVISGGYSSKEAEVMVIVPIKKKEVMVIVTSNVHAGY